MKGVNDMTVRIHDEQGHIDIEEEYDIEMAHRRAGWDKSVQDEPTRELVKCTQCEDWVDYYEYEKLCTPCYKGMEAVIDAVMA